MNENAVIVRPIEVHRVSISTKFGVENMDEIKLLDYYRLLSMMYLALQFVGGIFDGVIDMTLTSIIK